MRRPLDILLLPGPGRATRHLRLTRAKLWWWVALAVLLSVGALAAGFVATDVVMGGLPAWASP